MKEQLEILQKEGYTRLFIHDKAYRIAEALSDPKLLEEPIELLIDRLAVSQEKSLRSRLADSAETAFFEDMAFVGSVSICRTKSS